MKSLKYRITLWYSLFAIALTAMMLFAIVRIAHHNTDINVRDNLQITVNAVAEKTADPQNQNLEAMLKKEIDKKIIGIYNQDGTLLVGLQPQFTRILPDFQDMEIQNYIFNGRLFYTFDRLVHTDGQDVWVRGCVPALTPEDTVNSMARSMFLLMPLMVVFMLAGGFLIIRHALRPLQDMIQEADRIGSGEDLSIRISVPDSSDEISALGNTFNRMLTRLQQSFQRERQFTQDASHELRTPISVILAQCELEMDGDMTREEYADAFSMIRRQTNKMHCLTENLLQLCRLESGHQKMDSQPFNLSGLVTELVEEQKLLHPETEYQCHIALSITFTGDRQLLGQAITNLLNNAWKYGKGPICTNLSVIGGQICLSVQDHGNGISQELLEKIWDRFYQADSSRTSSRFSGFGLGLPITRQIISLHGGTITVKSSPEEGTIFLIFL